MLGQQASQGREEVEQACSECREEDEDGEQGGMSALEAISRAAIQSVREFQVSICCPHPARAPHGDEHVCVCRPRSLSTGGAPG